MSHRSNATIWAFLGTAIAVAILAGACGGASATASPTTLPAPTAATSPSAGAGTSSSAAASDYAAASASASAAASAAASDMATIGFPHVDAALEDLLPSTMGGIDLEKFSLVLSSYIASSQGGEKVLYLPWLVKFGKTPDDVNIAIAADLTFRENFVVKAIKVPGADAATLISAFSDVATKAGWPVSAKANLSRPVLEITDPTAQEAGILGVAYVYAKGDVLYVVLTDDFSLLIEGLASLP